MVEVFSISLSAFNFLNGTFRFRFNEVSDDRKNQLRSNDLSISISLSGIDI